MHQYWPFWAQGRALCHIMPPEPCDDRRGRAAHPRARVTARRARAPNSWPGLGRVLRMMPEFSAESLLRAQGKRSRTCGRVFKGRPDTGDVRDAGGGAATKEQAHLHTSVSELPGSNTSAPPAGSVTPPPGAQFLLELQEVTFVRSPNVHSEHSVSGRSSNKVIMISASHSSPSSLSSKSVQKSHYSTGPPGCPAGPQNSTWSIRSPCIP